MPPANDLNAVASPDDAVRLLCAHIAPVSATESVDDPVGRVLAQAVCSDRDQPPADLSLMDGFAVRLRSFRDGQNQITGEARAGAHPGTMPDEGVMRIATGAGMPHGADAVIKREDVSEDGESITIDAGFSSTVSRGANIRAKGSSFRVDQTVAQAGTIVSPAMCGAIALVGGAPVSVFRRIRIGLLATGDEVQASDAQSVTNWQVRDATTPALGAMFAQAAWCEPLVVKHVQDDFDALVAAMTAMLSACDAVLMTGGVSRGHRDFGPRAIEAIGGRILFHRLPQRPGHPALGAVSSDGAPLFGLPGNPISSLCVARRIAAPVLRMLAGVRCAEARACVCLTPGVESAAEYWRFVPVIVGDRSSAQRVQLAGSADIAGAGASDGFLEIPPGKTGGGPWPFYAWSVHT